MSTTGVPAAQLPMMTSGPTSIPGGGNGGGGPWWIDVLFRAVLYVGLPAVLLFLLGTASWKLILRYLDAADHREQVITTAIQAELAGQAQRLTTIEQRCGIAPDGVPPPSGKGRTR